MNKDTVLAVISDMQVGSTVALAPPKWQLYDGGTFHASPAQMVIHRQWLKSAGVVKNMLTETKKRKRLVVILNGEPIDNHHHDTPQLITKTPQEQIDMAISLLDEWLGEVEYEPKRGDCMYLVRGTDDHEKGEAIEQIGRDIDGVVPYRKDSGNLNENGKKIRDGRYHFNKLRRTVNGQLFHVSHHGFGRGTRPWTTENAIYNSLKGIYFDAIESGSFMPNFIVTSHRHVFNEAYYHGKQGVIYGCTTPSWQLSTHFVYKFSPFSYINTIGMVSFDVLASGATKVVPEYIEVEDSKVEEF